MPHTFMFGMRSSSDWRSQAPFLPIARDNNTLLTSSSRKTKKLGGNGSGKLPFKTKKVASRISSYASESLSANVLEPKPYCEPYRVKLKTIIELGNR